MTQTYLPHERISPDRIYTCWPAVQDYWPAPLSDVDPEYAAFLQAALRPGPDGETLSLTVLVADDRAEAAARGALGAKAEIVRQAYGDVWTRDTGPVFLREAGKLHAVRFTHNGWGGKYLYPGDAELGEPIARHAFAEIRPVDLIAEGGAFEFDGEGTVLTTRQCLLNANRNPGLGEAEIERRLLEAFGARKVLWVDEGLIADHTDGHIDNIVRFVAPGEVVCQAPASADDPQAEVLDAIARQLDGLVDAAGRPLTVHRIPGPGAVYDAEGDLMAASYLNYIIVPSGLVVPVYGTPSEAEALAKLSRIFDRPVTGVRANAILTGGGAFHCVTCHVPGEPK